MCDVTPCTSSDKQRSVVARKYRFDNNKWNLTTHRHHHGFRSRKKVNSQFHFHADTADFIHKIENIKPPADCWLCSFDISQIFTNCPINEILSAVRIAYDDFDKANFKIKCPPTDYLIYLLNPFWKTIYLNSTDNYSNK